MDWIKAQRTPPGFGTSGAGSVGHFLGELFQRQTGTTLNHVPYRGSGPMLADLLGGSIRIAFDTLPQNVEHIKDKRLRGLAVSVAQRSDMAPEVPTTAEAGFPDCSRRTGSACPARAACRPRSSSACTRRRRPGSRCRWCGTGWTSTASPRAR